MTNKIIKKFDLLTLGALATLVKGGESESKYIRRIYLIPCYLRMCSRDIKNKGKVNKNLFAETMSVLQIIRVEMGKHALTFGEAQLKVYSTMDLNFVSEEAIVILEGAMRLYMFGDPLFEKVVPDKVEAQAEKHEVDFQRKLLARQYNL